jgi:hypothetical protein
MLGINYFYSERLASPAPKANEDLVKAKFYAELAKAKNARL